MTPSEQLQDRIDDAEDTGTMISIAKDAIHKCHALECLLRDILGMPLEGPNRGLYCTANNLASRLREMGFSDARLP